MYAIFAPDNGPLLATLDRKGGGRSGRPVTWLVYWSLWAQRRCGEQPTREFATAKAAAEWVLEVAREALQR